MSKLSYKLSLFSAILLQVAIAYGGDQKFCPPFQCPKKTYPVPKTLKIKSTGCQDLSGVMMMSMGGAGMGGANDPLTPCCDQLSACYQICGTVQHVCVEKFNKCMDNVCLTSPTRDQCIKDVEMKKLLLNMSGCSKYDQGQRDSCECVKEKDVTPSRKRVLQKFYKSYSKEEGTDIDKKIDGLLEKVGTSSAKYATLLQKIVVKYPKSIKRVKDKGSQFMDDFMKKQDLDKMANDRAKKADSTTTAIVDDDDDHDDDAPVDNLDEL